MEKEEFMDSIYKQLEQMSVAQKDAWILSRAKLLSESEQQDFIMSLSGEKIITYMPTESEIDRFCESVQNGDICVEYEMHYQEFNSEGRYVDNWFVQHNDPQSAFPFLDRTFRGCHDLVRLGQYDLAGRILDKVCRLEFQVVEAEDSEGFEDDSPFTITDAKNEQLFSMNTYEIAFDWIGALLLGTENDESVQFARKLVDILMLELCKSVQMSDFSGEFSEKLLNSIEEILKEDMEVICADLEKVMNESRHWRERRMLEKKKARNQHLLLDINKKCKKQSDKVEVSNKVSVLKASWKQIKELLKALSYEPYIDDQLEIDEVWNICQALIKRDRFGDEDWNIRKKILKDMVSHEYYDCYGCYDPIKELAGKLYITDAEILEFADILNEHSYYAREAADLYRKYGRMEQYIQYLETHLEKSSKEYVELIACYSNDGKEAEARKVAEQGLQKCKDDQTELFIFLLHDAKTHGYADRYKKLYASAKKRKRVDIIRVNEAMMYQAHGGNRMLFLEYPKCSTCQKARKWLDGHNVEYTDRHIVEEHPSYEELKEWFEKSGLPLKKFFNTSGQLYRKMQLKDKLSDMSEDEQLKLLALDGMLVKRPLVIDGETVLVGFKEAEWEEKIR